MVDFARSFVNVGGAVFCHCRVQRIYKLLLDVQRLRAH